MLLALAMAQADPYLLDIGAPGRVKIAVTQTIDTQTGKAANLDDVVKAAHGKSFVYLGESHDRLEHHKMQAAVIEALAKAGRNVVVGFEMFTRPVQDNLNGWTLGWWDEATFIDRSDWKKQWGFDFALYKPIFDVVKANRLPMVAMNVPRDWVRAVGRGGYAALTPEQKKELPSDLYLGNTDHKAVFQALMGGHPLTGPQGDNVYSAQVLWDEGMADTAIKYMDARGYPPNTVFAVVAGSGHVMYTQGINYRVARRTGRTGVTVMMIEGAEPREVSRGLGEFVYMSPPAAAK